MMQKNFTRHKPSLVLAPHLTYPTFNGADIAVDRKWSEFSKLVPYVDIVGSNTITRYVNGEVDSISYFKNRPKSKLIAAVFTIIKATNYLYEKFITNNYKDIVKKIDLNDYSLVVFSYIYAGNLIKKNKSKNIYLVETHNYDIEWFDNLSRHSNNYITKLICYLSKRWVINFLRSNHEFFYTHVSESDMIGYRSIMPHHDAIIIPPGVDISPDEVCKQPGINDEINLIFIGSLGVQMNIDALNYFSAFFFPKLKKRLKIPLKITIVGSSPGQSVIALCKENSWNLEIDVSDDRLNELLSIATFSFLPFEYGAGVKLKLLKSLSLGIPVLATTASSVNKDLPYPCLISDDPNEWILRLQEVHNCLHLYDPNELVLFARNFTWEKMALLTLNHLSSRSNPMSANL
jgi:hypothetical protein